MKKNILLAICILSFTLSNKVMGQDKGLFTITVYESQDKAYNKIYVFEGEKKVEDIELVTFYYRDLESHIIEVNKILVKYTSLGYKIVSEIRGTIGYTMVTTYRLEK
jgi:hypothetical protein